MLDFIFSTFKNMKNDYNRYRGLKGYFSLIFILKVKATQSGQNKITDFLWF